MKFTNEQLRALSGIMADAGQVFFASSVVPFLIAVDKVQIGVLLSGLALTVASWIASIILVKGVKK